MASNPPQQSPQLQQLLAMMNGNAIPPALLQQAMQSLGVQGPAAFTDPTKLPSWYRTQNPTGTVDQFNQYRMQRALHDALAGGGVNPGDHLLGQLGGAMGMQMPKGGWGGTDPTGPGGPGGGGPGGGGPGGPGPGGPGGPGGVANPGAAWRQAQNIHLGQYNAQQLRDDPTLLANLNARQQARYTRYNTATGYQPTAQQPTAPQPTPTTATDGDQMGGSLGPPSNPSNPVNGGKAASVGGAQGPGGQTPQTIGDIRARRRRQTVVRGGGGQI